MDKRGKLIVIEGTDGSGKETQAKFIVERLKKEGVDCEFIGFPKYGTATGDIVGDCYLGKGQRVEKGSWFEDPDKVDPKVASLYYAADRRDSIKAIKKLLDLGINVISDRYYQSNMAHQGGKIKGEEEREKMFDWLENLELGMLELPKEDLVIFLHMPTETSFKLREERDQGEVNLDGHETNFGHLRRAEETYLQLAKKYNWKTIKCVPDGIDSLKNIEDIHKEVYEIVKKNLESEKKIEKGLFIAFEGMDGSGKSTQLKKFVEYLFDLNKYNHVVLTRNPYKDTNVRKIIRQDDDPFSQANKIAELYIEDRKKQVNEIIIPNLEKGNIVVSDRYKLSTIGYQTAQGLDMQDLIKRHDELPVPDITFVVDVCAEECIRRMEKENRDMHKFEENTEFINRLKQNYYKAKEILKDEKIIIINGEQTEGEVFKEIINNFEKIILKKGLKYKSIDEVPDEIKEKLKKYFTNIGRDNFVIHNLPSELTGGALARYSRALTGMQLTLINEFLDEDGEPCQEKGTELMDRILNAFGDESIGELEGVHLGIENASMILIKTIEDRRIGGSPIEQSTRYVKYDQKDKNNKYKYLRPKEIIEAGLLYEYEKVNDKAFEIYSELIVKLQDYFKEQFSENEFEIEIDRDGEKKKVKKHELVNENEERAFKNAYGFTIRCAALDVGRCVLPSSTLSQLGIFGNGRFFTNLINALKASELKEEKERGYAIEKELNKVIPTFIKRNFETDRFRNRNKKMREIVRSLFSEIVPKDDKVMLVSRAGYFDEIITGILYSYANISYEQILQEVKELSYEKKLDILKEYVGERESRRDRTPRGLENGYAITFDLLGCFAEYRDLQRHRMVTQQRQLLSTELGFVMPPEVIEVGFENRVLEVVKEIEELNKLVKERVGGIGDVAAQYVTLFNHRIRFVMGMNLREFQHLSELRTQPAGHPSYRAMTMEMAKQLNQREPWTKLTHGFIDYSDPGNKICRAREQARIAGKNLAKGVDGGVDY